MRALVPLGFLAGAALCALMLQHAPAAIAVDRAQPLVVVTYWQQFGAWMWVAFAVAIVVASVGYVGVLRERPSTSLGMTRGALGMTVVTSALACAAALLFPVVFSSDVYAYAGYGDMALHGINVYAHARIAVRDPLLDAVQWQWGNPPPMCVYGPAFVWLAKAIVAAFLPLGAAAPLWAFRVLACAALVACAPLAYMAFRSFPRSTRLAAAAGIALNPIAIWSAAEGHNDTLALAVVLGGFALAARSRLFLGAMVVALSALVKAPGAVAAIGFAISSLGNRSRFVRVAGGAATGIALVAALAIPLEYGVRAHLAPQGHYFPQFSLQYVSIALTVVVVVGLLAASWFDRLTMTSLRLAMTSLRLTMTSLRLTMTSLRLTMTSLRLTMTSLRLTMTSVLVLAAWLAVPNPYPWYAVWLLPVAFLAWRTYAGWALIAASLLIAVRYYPDATTDLSRPLSVAIVAIEFGIPLLLVIAHMVRARRVRREIRTTAPGFAASHSP